MRRRNLVYRFNKLSLEKRILMATSVVTILSCFLPWYGINSLVVSEWWDAFSSIGSVAGYLIVAFSLTMLALLAAPVVKPDLDLSSKLPFSEERILVFLSAQSCFVTLIFIPVYAQYALINATNSGSRFGIYITLLCTLISSLVAISHLRKSEKHSQLQDFATLPRQHQRVSEWDEPTVAEDPIEPVSYQQEDIFESQTTEEPVVAEAVSESALGEDETNQTHFL